MLTRLRVTGFKNLVDVDVRFGPFTCIAGPKNFLAFFAGFIARDENIPLLVDDRMSQALTLNERKDIPHAAFGTDSLVHALEKADRINSPKAAKYFLRLVQWRYRFILPPAGILKTFAEQYRKNLPGRSLQKIAEYVHDCMRDTGLFGGPEDTELKDSMAMRLYISWVTVIAKLIMTVWDDDQFSEDAASELLARQYNSLHLSL